MKHAIHAAATDGYESLWLTDYSYDDMVELLKSPHPIGHQWRAPSAEVRGTPGDDQPARMLSSFSGSALAMKTDNPEHFAAWRRILDPFGEFLPVNCSNAKVELFHCTNILNDAFDPEHGDPLRNEETGEIFTYWNASFHADEIPEYAVFDVEAPYKGGPYLTLPLLNDLRTNLDTTGIRFVSVWNSHDGPTSYQEI